MAEAWVRGRAFGQYLKEGYNLVKRHQVGDSPDDQLDLFNWLGCSKTEKAALKKKKAFGFETEIVMFKSDDNTK